MSSRSAAMYDAACTCSTHQRWQGGASGTCPQQRHRRSNQPGHLAKHHQPLPALHVMGRGDSRNTQGCTESSRQAGTAGGALHPAATTHTLSHGQQRTCCQAHDSWPGMPLEVNSRTRAATGSSARGRGGGRLPVKKQRAQQVPRRPLPSPSARPPGLTVLAAGAVQGGDTGEEHGPGGKGQRQDDAGDGTAALGHGCLASEFA